MKTGPGTAMPVPEGDLPGTPDETSGLSTSQRQDIPTASAPQPTVAGVQVPIKAYVPRDRNRQARPLPAPPVHSAVLPPKSTAGHFAGDPPARIGRVLAHARLQDRTKRLSVPESRPPSSLLPLKRKLLVDQVIRGSSQTEGKSPVPLAVPVSSTAPACTESSGDMSSLPQSRRPSRFFLAPPSLADCDGQATQQSHAALPTSAKSALENHRLPPTESQRIFDNGLGIPLSFHVLCDRPPRRKVELLIKVRRIYHQSGIIRLLQDLGGGELVGLTEATVLVVGCEPGTMFRSTPDLRAAFQEISGRKSRVIVSHIWVDECTTSNKLLDFRPYAVTVLEGNDTSCEADQDTEMVVFDPSLQTSALPAQDEAAKAKDVHMEVEDDDYLDEFNSGDEEVLVATSSRSGYDEHEKQWAAGVLSPFKSATSLTPGRGTASVDSESEASISDSENMMTRAKSRIQMARIKGSRPLRGSCALAKEHEERFQLLETKLRKWVKPGTKQNRGQFLTKLPRYVSDRLYCSRRYQENY
jgi:hypothetical protein